MNASNDKPSRALRILVVENHEDSRATLEMLLRQLGHVVRSVATMRDALAALSDDDTDVLISDIGLPDGDGWDLLRQCEAPHLPYAIAMSGFGMSADRERSRAAGYRHHLVKPMDIERLEELLLDAARETAAHG